MPAEENKRAQERKPIPRKPTGLQISTAHLEAKLSRLVAEEILSRQDETVCSCFLDEGQKGRCTCPGVALSQEGLSLVAWPGKDCPQTIQTIH